MRWSLAPYLLYPGRTSQAGYTVLQACGAAPGDFLRSPGTLHFMGGPAGGVAHRINYRDIFWRIMEQHDHLPIVFPSPTPFPGALAS